MASSAARHRFSFNHPFYLPQGEAALIADKAAQLSRLETGGGPLLRAQSARWLCFGAAGGTGPAALRHANLLCREFALGEALAFGLFGWGQHTSVHGHRTLLLTLRLPLLRDTISGKTAHLLPPLTARHFCRRHRRGHCCVHAPH